MAGSAIAESGKPRFPVACADIFKSVGSAAGGSRHVCKKNAEAAEAYDRSGRQWDLGSQRGRSPGHQHDRHDLQGERAVVDEQPDQLANNSSERAHGKTSAARRRARGTAARPTARKSAANTTIAR